MALVWYEVISQLSPNLLYVHNKEVCKAQWSGCCHFVPQRFWTWDQWDAFNYVLGSIMLIKITYFKCIFMHFTSSKWQVSGKYLPNLLHCFANCFFSISFLKYKRICFHFLWEMNMSKQWILFWRTVCGHCGKIWSSFWKKRMFLTGFFYWKNW